MQLVRRVFRQMLFALKNAEWDDEPMKLFTVALEKTIFHTTKCPKGLIFHICDFYIEEIAKISDGELSEDRTHALIEPFMIYYTKLNDLIILRHVEKAIFEQLLFQSELGQEYQETFDIWKKADFPTKTIDEIEINYQVRGNKSLTDDDLSDGEENDMDEERVLDPRAGRVNVNLTEIKFDALKLAETAENLRYKPFASSKSRKGLARMARQLRKFAEDVFPLGTQSIPYVSEENDEAVDVDLKAIQLAEFEKKLAIGDVDSESSDFDEDLDNRKHGKLKRKSKDEKNKTKDKKQKLSKLHNERFFEATEDFTKDQPVPEEDEDESVSIPKDTNADVKFKKKKKESSDETPRVKIQKRKSADITKVVKVTKATSPSTASPTDNTFKITDEWLEPLKEGEVDFFVPSRKTKLKALAQAEDIEINEIPSVSSAKKLRIDEKQQQQQQQLITPPRISLISNVSTNSGKRVKIALNKNQAQSAHEYIKQVKQSPNLPTNNLLKMPMKSVLKAGSLPSPINPFYQKKLSKNFNKSI